MATTTAVLQIKQGLEAAIRAAVTAANLDPAGQLVIDWGYPTTSTDDMVLLMRARSTQEARRSNRGRNEVATVDVHFLCWRSTQRQADEAAFTLLQVVDRQCRVVDSTLGGVVEECVLTATELEGYTAVGDRAAGRGAELIATFTTRALVTG